MEQHAYQPTFSLVTVTYNAGRTLGRTLESVEQQTYAQVEHLLIDGKSTDGTPELVRRYKAQNATLRHPHKITFLCEPDRGLYDAMNKAFTLATGDYICFLNAGDTLPAPDTLARLSASYPFREDAKKSFPALLYGDTNLVDDHGAFVRRRRLAPPEQLTWHSFKNGMLVCHQAFYARADLCETYDTRYRFSADYDWCIRLMRKADRLSLPLVNTHLVLANYLSEGITTQNHRASLCERLRIMAHHYGWPSAIGRHLWFVVRALAVH